MSGSETNLLESIRPQRAEGAGVIGEKNGTDNGGLAGDTAEDPVRCTIWDCPLSYTTMDTQSD